MTNSQLIWRLDELIRAKPILARELAVQLQRWIIEQHLETPEMAERRHQIDYDNEQYMKQSGRDEALEQINETQ